MTGRIEREREDGQFNFCEWLPEIIFCSASARADCLISTNITRPARYSRVLSSGIRSTGIRLSSNRPFLRGQHTKYTWNFQFLNPIKRGRAASSTVGIWYEHESRSGNDECRFSLPLPLHAVKRNFYTLIFNGYEISNGKVSRRACVYIHVSISSINLVG